MNLLEFHACRGFVTMTTDPLNAFHEWLYCTRNEPLTVFEIFTDIATMRRNGISTEGLPIDGITAQQWLERLAAQGRVKRLNAAGEADVKGSFWRWAEGVKAVKVEQRSLFG